MRAVRINEFGPPEVLQLVDADDPRPPAEGVVLEIEAIGLGHMDTMARRGGSYLGASPGFTPGYEVAGTVIDVGEGVESEWLRARVFAVLPQGGGCA